MYELEVWSYFVLIDEVKEERKSSSELLWDVQEIPTIMDNVSHIYIHINFSEAVF